MSRISSIVMGIGLGGARIAVAIGLACALPANAGRAHQPSSPPAQPPAPFVKEGITVKLAPHTFVIPDMNVGLVPNVGIVVGNRATLVIDTGLGTKNGEAVMREVRKVSRHDELYLVTTHFHPEHDLGAAAFPQGTRMIRACTQVQDIEEFDLELARTFSKRSPVIADLLAGATYRKADIVFDREHRLDLGGVRVRLQAVGPTHTRGDTIAWVEDDQVLFAGDVAMPALPAFASPYSSVRAWLQALSTLAALDAARVVPSHGDTGDARLFADYRRYLETLQRRARELKAEGQNAEAAAASISKELEAAYQGRQPGRIAAAARVAYAEATP
jgi:glyoxylase-like metal-dependent hydrolase (beta-lactamase superfamily II)